MFVNFNQNPLRNMVEIITLQQCEHDSTLYQVQREGKDDLFIDDNGMLKDI